MKLVIITAINEFEKEIIQLLKKSKVNTFSYKEVIGYKENNEVAIESNWFASDSNKTESLLFYAFVKKENVDVLFAHINEFNAKQKTHSHIHIAVLNIEKSN